MRLFYQKQRMKGRCGLWHEWRQGGGARGMRPEPCSATAADTLHYTNVIIMNVRHDNRGNHQNKSRLFTDCNMGGFCTIFSRFK